MVLHARHKTANAHMHLQQSWLCTTLVRVKCMSQAACANITRHSITSMVSTHQNERQLAFTCICSHALLCTTLVDVRFQASRHGAMTARHAYYTSSGEAGAPLPGKTGPCQPSCMCRGLFGCASGAYAPTIHVLIYLVRHSIRAPLLHSSRDSWVLRSTPVRRWNRWGKRLLHSPCRVHANSGSCCLCTRARCGRICCWRRLPSVLRI